MITLPIRELMHDVAQCSPDQLGLARFRYIDIASVNRESKHITAAVDVSVDAAPSRARQRVRMGDILISTVRPNLNGVALVPRGLDGQVASTGFCVLRPQVDRLVPEYLFYFSQSARFVAQLSTRATGASYPAVTDDDVLDIELPYRAVAQQREIVNRLVHADRVRCLHRYALELGEGFLGAVFEEMFRSALDETSTVEEIAERVTVGHVGETSIHYRAAGIPFLRTQNVRAMRISLSDLRFIAPEFATCIPKTRLKAGDVLVSRVGANRGMAAVVPSELDGAHCANVLIITPGARLIPEYLAFLINATKGQGALLGESVGSAQGVINTGSLAEWRIPIPPVEEQRAFRRVVLAQHKLIAMQREALRQAEHLFQALLGEAFDDAA